MKRYERFHEAINLPLPNKVPKSESGEQSIFMPLLKQELSQYQSWKMNSAFDIRIRIREWSQWHRNLTGSNFSHISTTACREESASKKDLRSLIAAKNCVVRWSYQKPKSLPLWIMVHNRCIFAGWWSETISSFVLLYGINARYQYSREWSFSVPNHLLACLHLV